MDALEKKKYISQYKIPVIKAKSKPEIVQSLISAGEDNQDKLITSLKTERNGLSDREAKIRLEEYGLNAVKHEKREFWLFRLLKIIANPLILLLLFLVLISVLTGDYRTAIVISLMVAISVALKFFQENQAYNSAEALRLMVKTTCTVIRHGQVHEIDLKKVVPGDIVSLSAGDLIPADLRLIESKELFINQSVLTGESLPVEKHIEVRSKSGNPLDLQNICFMGTDVESGEAQGVILQTGESTYFGSLAKNIVGQRAVTNFDRGIDRFTWLMIGFMLVLVPSVFIINGLSKGNWFEAFLFGVSVAVGLTPEMLPAIVAVNLGKGSVSMSKKKVIVKRLNSIQNFGAMNILCTDKTGTLTRNRVVLIKYLDINSKSSLKVLHFAYLNSLYQTGFKNLLDEAVLNHTREKNLTSFANFYQKVDELPFDFVRRRLSVIAKDKNGKKILICKGSVEEVTSICSRFELEEKVYKLKDSDIKKIKDIRNKLSKNGFRVISLAYRKIKENKEHFLYKDEHDLVFLGFMTFLDPPKESAAAAISQLEKLGVEVKVLTGDNELVTNKICSEVGLKVKGILMGGQIEKMTEKELTESVESVTIFAKLSPDHKKRVVEALQNKGNVVGFLGDGINDAPGLRAADVGISVNKAVDIAKESADIILLEMSLLVLKDGVIEGRRVFGNIIKYIKMGASSNFGNMFSVLGASLFLPFLPMQPSQLLVNNLLYDLSQAAIPTDNVDEEYVKYPRKWQTRDIGRFMLFIGPISSIFDYLTFFMMLFVFNAWRNPSLFQTGWFLESLMTQTMIVHVIRSRKIPFIQTWASKPLVITTILIVLTGVFLTLSPFAHFFNFVHLPLLYWPLVVLILISYVAFTQLVKTWYISRFGYN